MKRIDYSRTYASKARTMTRRRARTIKSAVLFMCIAFPANEAEGF